MVAPDLRPRTLEERIVYGAIVGTWGFWLLGALYVVAPVLGYMLVLLALGRRLVARSGEEEGERPPGPVPGRLPIVVDLRDHPHRGRERPAGLVLGAWGAAGGAWRTEVLAALVLGA